MDKPEQRFPVGSRVRLRDGVNPTFYEGFGLPGNEGWIKQHSREGYGYNRVFVEWDPNSWSYNGAPNCWTWEDHFELVEDSMSESKNSKFQDIVAEFVERLMAETDEPDEEPSQEEDFEETLEKAFADAREAKAFVMVTLNEETFPGGPGDFVVPVAYHAARDKKSSLICQMQLGDLALQFQERLVKERLDHGDGEG